MKSTVLLIVSTCLICALTATSKAATADGKHKLVLIAGKPSHPPREFDHLPKHPITRGVRPFSN